MADKGALLHDLPPGYQEVWDGIAAIRPNATGMANALLDFWEVRRDGASLPDWTSIDIATLQRWMGKLLLVEVLENGADFRYRLVGTEVLDVFGGPDLTGWRLSERAYATSAEQALGNLGTIYRNRQPRYIRDPLEIPGWRARSVGRLFLPFAYGDDPLGRILILVDRAEVIDRDPATDRSPDLYRPL